MGGQELALPLSGRKARCLLFYLSFSPLPQFYVLHRRLMDGIYHRWMRGDFGLMVIL